VDFDYSEDFIKPLGYSQQIDDNYSAILAESLIAKSRNIVNKSVREVVQDDLTSPEGHGYDDRYLRGIVKANCESLNFWRGRSKYIPQDH
jgi:hypothetical protein